MASVKYKLKIEAELTQSGDYMRKSTIDEFLKWAKNEARYFTVMIKEGVGEPKLLPAKITVESVTICEGN